MLPLVLRAFGRRRRAVSGMKPIPPLSQEGESRHRGRRRRRSHPSEHSASSSLRGMEASASPTFSLPPPVCPGPSSRRTARRGSVDAVTAGRRLPRTLWCSWRARLSDVGPRCEAPGLLSEERCSRSSSPGPGGPRPALAAGAPPAGIRAKPLASSTDCGREPRVDERASSPPRLWRGTCLAANRDAGHPVLSSASRLR